MSKEKPKLTHADELKILDFEVYRFRLKMFKLSKTFRHVRISEIEVTYSETAIEKAKLWWQFWKK